MFFYALELLLFVLLLVLLAILVVVFPRCIFLYLSNNCCKEKRDHINPSDSFEPLEVCLCATNGDKYLFLQKRIVFRLDLVLDEDPPPNGHPAHTVGGCVAQGDDFCITLMG
mmetsp:Transcript_16575/g.24351  ORF Transcript_16575/g.24351 Transcript_16575/m.24351 type:complete len:112 (+) Transcript_16575:144-479(+)